MRLLLIILVVSAQGIFAEAKNSLIPNVYLTFQREETATNITVNYHSAGANKTTEVYYDTQTQGGNAFQYKYKASGNVSSINTIDKTYHHAELTNLSPNETYYFVVGNEAIGFSKEYKFKTIPNDGSPIVLMNGGDMGTSSRVYEVAKPGLKENPHAILIGGDIAYANDQLSNERLWLKWWEIMRTVSIAADGRLIPLIVGIGNHEVKSGPKAEFFEAYFHQGGLTYFHRMLGSYLSLTVLDSGHLVDQKFKQSVWLKETLAMNQGIKHRVAMYHIPMYPSHRSYNDSRIVATRNAWQPLFDQYELTVGLEHHDHAMKRTYPLRDNKVVEDGTVYIGDGAFGVETRPIRADWYIAKAESVQHIWMINVNSEKMRFRALDKDGKVLDDFTR